MLDHSIRRTLDPATEPVTLDEVRRQCNAVALDEDLAFDLWIAAAREMVEAAANRSLVTQTWRLQLSDWPVITSRDRVLLGDCELAFPRRTSESIAAIELPRPPLQSVSSITYYDADGVQQTLATSVYQVDADREPAVIVLRPSQSWPTHDYRHNGIAVTYVAGYGAESAVPARAKQAILLLVAHWYRVREAVGTVGSEVALAYQALINSLKPGRYP